jgi:hypothetical protein
MNKLQVSGLIESVKNMRVKICHLIPKNAEVPFVTYAPRFESECHECGIYTCMNKLSNTSFIYLDEC